MTGASAIGVPGWPELACWTASIDSVRIVLTHSWSIAAVVPPASAVTLRVVPVMVVIASPNFLVRPRPVDDLRPIGAILVGVAHVVDDGVLHLLLQVGGSGAKLRHAIDDVDHQVEAGRFIQHRQL